jgi:excinuclease ABC subunit C
MEAAAEAMEYELAARFRDQVRVLQHILSKQFVETTSERDADIIAVAESSGTWCVNLAMVRGGRHLGDKPFFPANVHAPDHASMLEAFITQHYADQSPPASIIVDGDFNTGDWQETLSGLAGRQVRVVSRPIGEARQWMLMAAKNASYAIARRLADRASQDAKIRALNDALGSDGVPPIERVECFDVSHTMGEATVASCVVFDQGAMQSSQYRIYNITGITPGDDYAAMRNALTRRYKKVAEQPEDETAPRPRPDLVLIDGGKGQLSVAEEVMTELGLGDILLIGVAKGEERKPGLETLIFGIHSARPREELHLEKDNLGFHLIQQIRDEAHRFAITGHRARRGKKRNTSRLEDVKGVGPKRRKALLQQFGGLQGVISASVEDLSKVEGISHELAEVIYNELH